MFRALVVSSAIGLLLFVLPARAGEFNKALNVGEDAPDILRELGYSATEIEAIFTRGGIRRPSEAQAAKAAD